MILETKSTTLRLDVADGKVIVPYFGEKLADSADAPGSSFFYPSHWDSMTGPHAIAITQPDGQLALDPEYVSHTISDVEKGKLLKIVMKDKRYPVGMTFCVLAHPESNVFEQWVEIENQGKDAVTIEKAASASMEVKADRYFVTSFKGSWGRESTMQEQELEQGSTIVMRSGSTPKGAAAGSPAFILSLDQPAEETSGEVILGSLAWSGNWEFTFDSNGAAHSLRAGFGYDPANSRYKLEGGKSFVTPRMMLTRSKNGVGEASRNFHRWARNEGGILGGNQVRDILLNSWEGAYFTFDEKLLHGMMDGCKQMGVELFVLDDGWFGNKHPRNDSKAGLGDWQVNATKLPNGIQGLINAAKERGLKFGIWVEPEMVNPKSELYEKHPDWVISMKNHPRREGRTQLILDLSNPDVREFIYKTMADLLTANPEIAYIKWDCNFTIIDPGSNHLPADAQKNLQVDYINGYYSVMDRLVKKFPKVVFQACGSGGGRADYGAMKYHHEFWTSDNTDPYDRVFIQWGHSMIFPAIAMGAHVSESPNHQSKRETPLKFRFDVAMSGRLGLELQPQRLKPEEVAWANKAVAEYKRIRPVVQLGDLYRLKNPYKGDMSALQYVNGKSSVVFAYQHKHRVITGYGPLKLQGLDPAKRYKVSEINKTGEKSIVAQDGKVVGGDFLMNSGITVNWNWQALQSTVIELTEQ